MTLLLLAVSAYNVLHLQVTLHYCKPIHTEEEDCPPPPILKDVAWIWGLSQCPISCNMVGNVILLYVGYLRQGYLSRPSMWPLTPKFDMATWVFLKTPGRRLDLSLPGGMASDLRNVPI